MPVGNILKHKIGQQLAEWIYLGIRTGMRRGVADYQRLKLSQPVQAELAIKRAIDMPHRARARINEAVAVYGMVAIDNALLAYGAGITRAELNTELTSLEAYAQGLVNRKINNSETWDSLATDIETNISLESEQWTFPFPTGYMDVWGE